MKRFLCLVFAIVMLIAALPTSALAFDRYVVYSGQAGCQLTEWSFTQSLNPWLLWDVAFNKECDDRVWVTAKEHPNLVGRSVIPTFGFEGDAITFNGESIESGVTSVVLEAENELVITTDTLRAEYQISITEETNGLPVVLIDTDNAPIPDKIDYVTSTISVLGADIYGGDDIYAAPAGIKLRGNSTMGYAKKPYRIKFDKKQNVFGLGKAKSWVLLANYLDPASIRNDIAYAFGERLNTVTKGMTGFSMYVPRMRPVEVYLNGEYKGLYDMGDHIQVDETRIAIDESGDELDDNDVQLFPEANVGYYLEVEDSSRVLSEYENEGTEYFTISNTTSGGNTLYVQFKTPEIPSAEQKAYISDYLQTVNDLIRARDEAVWDYIDMDGFIDWYLVNELFKNTDSGFLSSVKMFKDKDGKLSMGPVWDFDLGSGAVAYSDIDDPTGWRTRAQDRCDWYVNLFQMDSFVTAFEARWAKLHEEGVFDKIFEDIDNLKAYLDASANEDYALWHDTYVTEVNNTSWLTVPEIQLTENWDVQIQYFTTYMKARIAWMDEQFGYGETSGPDYVNFLSSALSSTSSSKTFTINKSFNVQELSNIYLSVTSQSAFDITFNFDIGSPALSTDWHGTKPELPFQGTTGTYIPAGTYTDKELNLENYLPWSSNPSASTITLKSIVVKSQGSGSRRNVRITGLYAAASVQEDVSTSTSLAIAGEPVIWGSPEYKKTLKASTMAITPYGAAVSYQWYADGVAVSGATSSAFTPDASYIGKTLYVEVSGTGAFTGKAQSAPIILEKASYDYRTTQVVSLVSKTHDTVVVSERTNYEISIDGVNWQTSGTFTGLEPNTLYRVYYRHGETAEQTGGQAGDPLYVITDVDPDAPVTPDPEPDPDPVLPGDVDADGIVNTTDAKLILRHLMNLITLEEPALASADFNEDGVVNTSDVRLLLTSLVTA
ncbi:MAG: hypothetical protein E7553_05270 [Ruminococcaceae bacterium]|nr:hypothetical protein [Oscillospiraceae bacterium]